MALMRALTILVMLHCDTSAKVKPIEETRCEDEYVDCGARADQCHGDNVELVLSMLTHCKETCRQHFNDR